MNLRHVALAVLMVGLMAMPAVRAEVVVRDTEVAAPPAPANLGPYQGMAEAVGLSDDQQKKLTDQYAKMQDAQRKFLEANQAAWADAMAKAADTDAQTAAVGKERVAKLQAQYDQTTAAEHAKVMAVLTKEQALKWEQQTLATAVEAALFPAQIRHGEGGLVAERLPLSGVQKKILSDCCAAAAKTIQAWPNPYDPAKRKDAIAKLMDDVCKELAKANALPAAPDEK